MHSPICCRKLGNAFSKLDALEILDDLEALDELEALELLEKLEALAPLTTNYFIPSHACRGEQKRVCDPLTSNF